MPMPAIFSLLFGDAPGRPRTRPGRKVKVAAAIVPPTNARRDIWPLERTCFRDFIELLSVVFSELTHKRRDHTRPSHPNATRETTPGNASKSLRSATASEPSAWTLHPPPAIFSAIAKYPPY